MPIAQSLPASIAYLSLQNAAPMHNNQYFEQDINALIDDITRLGVFRKTQGYIVNPPSAGFLTRRKAVAVFGIPFAFVVVSLGVMLFLGYLGFQFVSGFLNGSATNGAHATLTHFCSAMQASDYTTAYGDLTSDFQASIGSPSHLATKLTTDFAGQQIRVIGCHPFDQSPIDGFYHESGNTASDQVEFDAVNATGSSQTVGGKTMFFAKQNGVWKIERVQND